MKIPKNSDPVDIIQFLLIVAVIIMLLMVAIPAKAQDQDCGEYGYGCVNTSVNTPVNTPVNMSSDSLMLGFSSPRFGAAIADCLGTTASSYLWGIFGRQRLQENYWCEAANLIQAGYAEAGTWILCNKTILKDMEGCPGPVASMIEVIPPDDFQEQFQMADMRYSELAEQLNKIEASNQANVKAAARRRAEDAAFKQQTIERVQAIANE